MIWETGASLFFSMGREYGAGIHDSLFLERMCFDLFDRMVRFSR